MWFLDETAATTEMGRSHGRCPRGRRLGMPQPHGHWKTTTFVAALTPGGMAAGRALDGAMSGDRFEAYVREVLVPALRPGDVVVLDNLSCHKRAGARAAVEAAGCELRFLPPYSPDLNPIEKAFSKLKARLRKAACRTVESLRECLDGAAEAFTREECRNYFQSCGYYATVT